MLKRGFTLIELLAVIVILGVIMTIAIPKVQNALNESKQKLYDTTVSDIEKAAKDYTLQYGDEVPGLKDEGSGYITINDMIAKGILEKTPKDPKTGDNFNGDYAVKVTKSVNGSYTFDYLNQVAALPDYIESEGVNRPKLTHGMTAIKWNGSSWIDVSNPNTDTSWYNYANKEWANAKTSDGSYWVWIPRYIYKISSGWHTFDAGTINIQFSKGTNDGWNSDVIGNVDTGTTSNASNNIWTNHQAFTFGTTELTGFWVAKFEATASEGVANGYDLYGACENVGDNVTTKTIKIVPNVTSWRCINIGNAYTNTRKMETNSVYGWGTSGAGVDTHLIKNVEWGATAYLSDSDYGKKDVVWINAADNNTTGCAGDEPMTPKTSGCLRTYNTDNGVKASTTGNIYGVYDMSGGAWEFVSAYLNNSHPDDYGQSIYNANNKYADIYTVGSTDNEINNYTQTVNKKGDAIYETSSSNGENNSWFENLAAMSTASSAWFIRGASFLNDSNAGIFAFSSCTGHTSCDVTPGFRPVLLIAPNL